MDAPGRVYVDVAVEVIFSHAGARLAREDQGYKDARAGRFTMYSRECVVWEDGEWKTLKEVGKWWKPLPKTDEKL